MAIDFNALYEALDSLDTPLGEIKPINNSKEGISARASHKLNIRKRALSYYHGAYLAVEHAGLDEEDKEAALKAIAHLYEYFDKATDDYIHIKQSNWKPRNKHSQEEIENFVRAMSEALVLWEISSKDIQAGEMLANLERKRPATLKAKIVSKNSQAEPVISEALILETPQKAQLSDEVYQKSFDFLLNQDKGLTQSSNYTATQRQALYTYENENMLGKAFINAMAGIGWAIKPFVAESNKIFSYFLGQLKMVQNKNKAKEALKTAAAPKWYQKQNRVVREYLLEKAREGKLEDLPALPSTLRGVPGLPNFTVHRAGFSSTNKENFSVSNSAIRHGILTPYKMDDDQERENATLANGLALNHFITAQAEKNYQDFWAITYNDRKIPVADISLLSPLRGEGLAGDIAGGDKKSANGLKTFLRKPSWGLFKEANGNLKNENKEGYLWGFPGPVGDREFQNLKIKHDPRFEAFSLNLGINGDRFRAAKTFQCEKYQDTVDKTLALFDLYEKRIEPLIVDRTNFPFQNQICKNKYRMAQAAKLPLNQMRNIFKDYTPGSDKVDTSKLINAELFANCLYAIMIQGMGGTVSVTCKSSKDRTGLFLVHLDAMYQYYAETGTLISYDAKEDSPERIRFVEIFAKHFLSDIQQTMASQTTYGASGLKVSKGASGAAHMGMSAMPTDIQRKLEELAPGVKSGQEELAKMNKLEF